MKSFFALLSLMGILIFPSTSYSASIAAVVNNKVISIHDLQNRVKMTLISSGAQDDPKVRKEIEGQVLQTLIDEEIQLQIGEEFGITFSSASLESAIRDIENQNNMPAGGLKDMLKHHGIPFSVMLNHIKASIIWREYIRQRYANFIQVSDSDVERAQAELKASLKETRYDLSEIVLYFNNKNDINTIKNAADRLVTQLRQGAQFTMLAQQFSNAPTASRGGHIGWVPESKLEPFVQNSLKVLTPGSITEPLKSPRGYHIYLLRDKLTPGQHARPQTLYSFKQVFIPMPEDAFEFEIQEKMRTAATIAKQITSCRVVEKLVPNKDAKIQMVNDVPDENLPDQLRTLLSKTKVGRGTEPVFTGNGAMIFVLCDKRVTNPQAPTKDDIHAQLVEVKLQGIAAQELRTRRASAHVDKRF